VDAYCNRLLLRQRREPVGEAACSGG